MTLYRCSFHSPGGHPLRGVLAHCIEKNNEGKWVRVINRDPVIKISYDGIVLKLEEAKIVSPFISVNWDTQRSSVYHICLYQEMTVAISDNKWNSYFKPIETK